MEPQERRVSDTQIILTRRFCLEAELYPGTARGHDSFLSKIKGELETAGCVFGSEIHLDWTQSRTGLGKNVPKAMFIDRQQLGGDADSINIHSLPFHKALNQPLRAHVAITSSTKIAGVLVKYFKDATNRQLHLSQGTNRHCGWLSCKEPVGHLHLREVVLVPRNIPELSTALRGPTGAELRSTLSIACPLRKSQLKPAGGHARSSPLPGAAVRQIFCE
ncbi:uncharacterized protein IWZ02DRAFT_435084 [Phyllosticta citriasiana]|uniref:uncharacterized protein n=1 Tax=Phyllosticta citriasiana TaxID=595635 RepID=UPI0030FD319A